MGDKLNSFKQIGSKEKEKKNSVTGVYFGKTMKKDWVYNKIPVDLLIAKSTLMYSLISLYRL